MTARRAGTCDAPHLPDTLVILRPIGRGNWEPVEMRLSGRRAPRPLEFSVNQRLEIAGQAYRVSKILSC